MKNAGERLSESFRLDSVTDNDVLKQINELKDGVNWGEDQIDSNIIKNINTVNVIIIIIVFSTGVFPECLKTTIVIPLFKQGDRKEMNNLLVLLFNIYINDIFIVTEEGEVYCFVDEAGVVICGDDWVSTIKNSELALSEIKKLFEVSLLLLNVDKIKLMVFSLSTWSLPFRALKLQKAQCTLDEQCTCDIKEMLFQIFRNEN